MKLKLKRRSRVVDISEVKSGDVFTRVGDPDNIFICIEVNTPHGGPDHYRNEDWILCINSEAEPIRINIKDKRQVRIEGTATTIEVTV